MIRRLLRKRLHRPEALKIILHDATGRRGPVLENGRHLDEAARWLLRAQAATPDDGVSGGYFFGEGWIASYPETTGYVIPTLLAYGKRCGDTEFEKRSLAMAEWELQVQHACGGIPGHFVDHAHPPVVFNTGQVIFGWLAAYECTRDHRFLDGARRAGTWLADVQDDDGAWRRFDYRDVVHVYNTRTAWALIELGLMTGESRWQAAGTRHLDWALRQQDSNGWFRHCGFVPDEAPLLHTIAYTTQGLLEAGVRLSRADYISAAARACRAVLGHTDAEGFIPATFDPLWRPTARYSCLTGNAQIAAQWFRLHDVQGDREFLDGAHRATRYLKTLQDCETTNSNVRGAVKASHPIWGRYLFGSYPNWATKFFMDALMMEQAAVTGDMRCIRCW